jgi:hypothetical protein
MMLARFFPFFVSIVAIFLIGSASALAGRTIPFDNGEKLTYQLKWGVIPAGEVTLEVLPNKVVDGQEMRHFRMTARTNSFVDVFYKVRNRIDGYTDLPLNRSLYYEKVQREGSRERDIVITFDWRNKTARYSNFGKSRKQIALSDGAFDPFSVIYYCRTLDLSGNQDITRPVTDGKKEVVGKAKFRGRQTITINNTPYDTVLIEPDLQHIGGVFQKSKNAKLEIWFTADDRKIPVKVKSKVAVGSFVAELIDMKK